MIVGLSFLLINKLGITPDKALKWARWIFIGTIAVIIILIAVLFAKFCGGREAASNINQEQIDRINTANRTERLKELQKVVEDNAQTVTTVNNSTTIAETNVIERDRLIDEKVKDVDKVIQQAKEHGRDITAEELECLLAGKC